MGDMEKTQHPIPWLSGGLAALVALLLVAATIPNTDRVRIDPSFNPPRTYHEAEPFAVCGVLVIAFAPVLCIFILGRRKAVFSWLGWCMLAYLLLFGH
jgi:hypothetical protein